MHDPLAAADFNVISTFEDRPHVTLTDDDLEDIGAVFLQHNMSTLFGAGLVHRHFELDDSEIMCHDETGQCRPVSLRQRSIDNLSPHSFYMDGSGRFKAYEYSEADTMPGSDFELPKPFKHQLRRVLIRRRLAASVAVVRTTDPRPGHIQVETLIPGRRSMLTHSMPESDLQYTNGHAETTAWSFSGSENKVIWRAFKKCVLMNTGFHNREKD